MSESKQPEDHPENAETATIPHEHAPGGVPHEMDGDEAKGTPHSDRAKTENAGKAGSS